MITVSLSPSAIRKSFRSLFPTRPPQNATVRPSSFHSGRASVMYSNPAGNNVTRYLGMGSSKEFNEAVEECLLGGFPGPRVDAVRQGHNALPDQQAAQTRGH